MSTSSQSTEAFRALHAGEPFVIPNPWDAGSARMLEELGFKALATTSSGFAFTLGRADGDVTLDEVVSHTDPECEQATLDAVQLLTELGHEVEEVQAPWGEQELLDTFVMAFGTPIAMGLYFGGMVTGREPSPELVEPLSWIMYEGIRERSALDYLLARTQLSAISRGIIALWETYDVIVTPALAQRPVRIGEIDACSDDPWEDFRASGLFTPYTAIFNVSGQPAVSLPLSQGDDGLPTAVQFAGRPADEATLLSLAAQLEAARPWADRRPELAAA